MSTNDYIPNRDDSPGSDQASRDLDLLQKIGTGQAGRQSTSLGDLIKEKMSEQKDKEFEDALAEHTAMIRKAKDSANRLRDARAKLKVLENEIAALEAANKLTADQVMKSTHRLMGTK